MYCTRFANFQLTEISERDTKLQVLQEELDRRQKQREQNAASLDQSFVDAKKGLEDERCKKLDAYREVDRLHRQLDERDAVAMSSARINTAKIRVKSAIRQAMKFDLR